METILGIDLGTTNSAVSIIRDGQTVVLEEDGQKTLPSVVGLDSEGKLLVGAPAHNQWTLAPDRTVRSVKRQMGSSETVQLGDQTCSPQEISAIILRTLKERAQRQIGHEVRKAVITVPAFFNEQQREATREAGELAGLEVVRIINEPTAAALTYNSNPDKLERLLVYDLGGGTFDVSIVQIEQDVVEVMSSHGDTKLGGDDFDELLMDFVCDKFEDEYDVDLRATPSSRSRVLKAVEEAKRRLSFEPFTTVQEEFITEKAGVPLHLDMEIARLDYEQLIEPLLEKTLVCIDQALSDAKLPANQIDRVILVGGASRTPLVHHMLQEQLGQPIHTEVDPDLCVSMGAAIQGGLISGLDLGPVLVDITPHTLGINCIGSLNGHESHYCCASIIERNTALPASRSELFHTAYDGQTEVNIAVFQGEDPDTRHNQPVGDFMVEGLADVKRGNPILVRFDLDLDDILTVTATEKTTGLEKQLTIDNAMSRFRSEDRDATVARLNEAFAESGPAAAEEVLPDAGQSEAAADGQPPKSAPEPVEELSPELQLAIGKAHELIDRANALAADANELDGEEIRELLGQLQAAIQRHSLEDMSDVTAKLDDLVFYLQDAT
jgi:molecular chaperone DnaK